ncbi:MAG TPA: nitronate monooxygenase [Mycobacterium sp.]|uniref:NAD(P)H-dependent flavin oxidoreductase n=1 Tax=Mycobacterium sp. TaxID=1785 RepID=UPI002D3DE44E|nr:nitronate monooxygenase [Mycobacterium sp.]HZU49176.1 nitronate monooxygenase [Mycobacterium sp.]
MLRTRFTEIFDLRAPMMLAPMAFHTGATVAAAVSSGGALGSFGGVVPTKGPQWISAEVSSIRAATDRPFAVGFITQAIPMVLPLFEATLAEQVPAVMFSFGDPTLWLEQAKTAGATVICQVQTLADADLAVEAGTDILIAQGIAAGGHTGTMSLLPFLSAVVTRFPNIPVLAAGGIADGRTLAAVLTAGADGALVGTAFLATPEAVEVHDLHKRLIVESDGTDTVFTHAYDIVSGFQWPGSVGERVRSNRFTDEWAGREAELHERRDEFAGGNMFFAEPPDPETDQILYGEGAGFVTAIRPAAEVIRMICGEAEEILRSRPPTLLA